MPKSLVVGKNAFYLEYFKKLKMESKNLKNQKIPLFFEDFNDENTIFLIEINLKNRVLEIRRFFRFYSPYFKPCRRV